MSEHAPQRGHDRGYAARGAARDTVPGETADERSTRMAQEMEGLTDEVRSAAATIAAHTQVMEQATSRRVFDDARRAIDATTAAVGKRLQHPGRMYEMRPDAGVLHEAKRQLETAQEEAARIQALRETEWAKRGAGAVRAPDAASSLEGAGPETMATVTGVPVRDPAPPVWERELMDVLAARPGGTDADAFRRRLVTIREALAAVPEAERGVMQARLSGPAEAGDELAQRFQSRLSMGTRMELLTVLGGGTAAAEPASMVAEPEPDAEASQPLPHLAEVESAFGASLGDVEAHTGMAAELAPHGAAAMTVGNTVLFADAQPSVPLATHEATHVLQNRQAGASAAMAAGVVAARDCAAEAEADANAASVAAHGPGVRLPSVTAAPSAHVHLSPVPLVAPDATPVQPIAAEDSILAMLNRRVDARDVKAIQQRVGELIETFAALSTPDRRVLRSRLVGHRPDDKLAAAFQYRLSTPTRTRLIRALDGEPTPIVSHETIEPDAFVAGLDDTALRTTPDRPMPVANNPALVTASIMTALSPAEGHITEVALHLTSEDAVDYGANKIPWPAKQPGPLELDLLDVDQGRTTLTAEIVVDGTVRRIFRKVIEAGLDPIPGVGDLPATVVEQVRGALADPIRPDKRGHLDEEQVVDVLSQLAAIAPPYRPAVVAQLSAAPSGADSLAALFFANMPSTVRPRVIAALTSGSVEPSPEMVDSEVSATPFMLDVSPRPLVIAPWMPDGAKLKVQPKDPHASDVQGLPAAGPDIEVFWTVMDGVGERSEHMTTWQLGNLEGDPLELDLRGPGTYQITAHFSQDGIVGQTVNTEATVILEDESERAAADQMDSQQLVEERGQVREQLADGAQGQAADDLWMRAAALDANIAATGVEEQPPKVAEGDEFAAQSWLNHLGQRNPPLSTDRAHLRYLLEQRYKAPDMSSVTPLDVALQAYINDGRTEADNRARAQTILGLVQAEHAAMLRELNSFQDAFAKQGQALCLQLLDEGRRDVLDKQREYGFSAGQNGDVVRDNIEALAIAARELLSLQNGISAQQQTVADLERQMNDERAKWDADNDDLAALERSEELRQILMGEQDGIGHAEEAFLVRKGELVGEFPVLAIANTGDPAKQAMSANMLRRIGHGDLADISSKLDSTLTDIGKVEAEVQGNADVVWSVPQLLALTKDTLGVTPLTFQDRAVQNKLNEIKAGKIIKAVSQVGVAILATVLSFGAAGPLTFVIDAAVFAQDLYEVSKSIKEYRFQQALTGTHYDQAKALSQDEPSTFWLAFEIVTTLVGVADATRAAKGLNQARKVFGEVRAARKAVAAVEKAEHVATKLDEIADLAGAHGLSGDVQRRLRREALEEMAQRVDDVGDTARRMLHESEDFAAKAATLQDAVRQHAATLGDGKPASDFQLEVLSKAEFEARFGSKKGRAVFTMNDGKPTIFARFDAQPAELADEAAHLVQLGDPKLASDLKYLDEANLDDWKKMSVSDKLEFYQRKLNVEIDAKRRTMATLTDPDELETATRNLEDLEGLQADVASITPDQLDKMNAGLLKEPAFLDQPARAFTKKKVVVDGSAPAKPDLAQVDPNAPPPRAIAKDKKSPDYSTAYGDKNVTSVQQHGDVWHERVIVTSGYEGKVKSIKPGKNGSTVIEIQTEGGHVQRYTIEAGAEIPETIKKGAPIAKDAKLADEVPRDYRWVEVEYADGTRATRAEIKSARDGVGWVPRGREATERGAAAEADAMKEADDVLKAAKKAGDITDFAHLPSKHGGGGFDDVIVEFSGAGDDLAARIRIREIKDYPNRTVPLGEFTAINDNWAQNLEKLKENVGAAIAGKPPRGFEKLDPDQLAAIQRKLDANDFEVEIRLGDTTKVADPGHHASTVLPALETATGKKIDVRKIGASDR